MSDLSRPLSPKTVIHVALFRWKAGTSKSEISSILSGLQSLATLVPGLQAVYAGENFSMWSQGFTHGVVIIAKDPIAFERYRTHHIHRSIAARVDILEESSLGFDFQDVGGSLV